ncbi:hypothetical protein [Lacinutrix algicola]|uniref:hypothetical protein n=1 Tax=Lacinutrix algicola TaxID=342954 RepID=UPI0006E38B28|nr:hypothetical protein [Lacinutrix algicola]
MKNFLIVFCVALALVSCKNEVAENEVVFVPRDFNEVEIGLILRDSSLNVRAIDIIGKDELLYATSNGQFGSYNYDSHRDNYWITPPYLISIDSIKFNFRAVASTSTAAFLLSIGSPAYVIKQGESGKEIVYQEDHKKAFYDAMAFWNDKEGIAIGDPTDSCLSIIITRDGGDTWNKLSCDILPEAINDEAAFAASDTNIAIVGDETWVATGGGASRILYSPNKGETWEVFNTPIVQGNGPQGMYSLDFYDNKNGFAIGGDYTKPADSSANKIRTADGGKTWQLVAQNQNPGYRSCVQYIPGREAKELVAIGFKGIDYSNDAGDSWRHLSDEGFYTLRFVNDSVAYAAGSKRIAKLTFR